MAGNRVLRIGLTQWDASTHIERNVKYACSAITSCAEDGADVVLLPENGLMLGTNAEMREAAFTPDSELLHKLEEHIAKCGVVTVVGGLKYRIGEHTTNSALVYGADGTLRGRYDKLHLFDANIGGQSFEASTVEAPGERLTILEVAGIKIGLLICYDIRFPEASRKLAAAGAEVLLYPAAFLEKTGSAHWQTLLQSRAIENLAYVVASTTVASDDPSVDRGFRTWGHAMAVGPWGEVLADLGSAPYATRVLELDMAEVERTRTILPVLHGVRPARIYDATPLSIAVS
ncbi:nitrilase-related carbon-nitrogen hydrolase [Rhodococcus globerulus]|uniref:nitrilase-related carbon-nitrogen hydrolase n=1 Tax=Rhodococcus globerulus TaxID=33008 RepID=UPI000527D471|nr:nitrilase-related carbon-nitrogen hydrolase [Rhodococcus globerulus]PVX59527.1 putative amidohydrolase [Rhodococcus globerulus]